MTKNNKRITKLILLLAWMVVIFLLSGKLGAQSGSLSSSTIADVQKYLPSLSEQVAVLLVRKAAHILMYAVLGILTINLLSEYKLKRAVLVGYSLLIVAVYASFDEIHQYFVGGRSSSPRDVLIDVVGGLIGIGIFIGACKLWQARKNHVKVVR